MTTITKSTPMMDQWIACKKKAKDSLLLFRLGDFYEAFYEDAYQISKELNLTLTQRQQIPMCGVPFHASETYIDKLVEKGYKVAIAEQTEDAKLKKGLVNRDVVRIVSPGTIIDSKLLNDKTNNFFVSIDQVGSIYGLCLIDLSTSELKLFEYENKNELIEELYKLKPKEFLISKKFQNNHKNLFSEISNSFSYIANTKEDWHFDHKTSYDLLSEHFNVHSLDCFGLKGFIPSINAAGALFSYLLDDLHLNLDHFTEIQTENSSSYMSIDHSCMKNLELVESNTSNNKNTLIALLDNTFTPMGARLLQRWLKYPLMSCDEINKRYDAIEEVFHSIDTLSPLLKDIRDIERMNMKIKSGYAMPKDIVGLRFSLENIHVIKQLLSSFSSILFIEEEKKLHDISDIVDLIKNALVDNPPLKLSDADVFKEGYCSQLDEIKKIKNDSKEWIMKYQKDLRESTNIKNLKVGFTKVFGYYIDISKGQVDKTPEYFHRKQTLTNSERFYTEELKDFEYKVLTAEQKIKAIEAKLFNELREKIAGYSEKIASIAKAIATIDSILSLSITAKKNNYTRPVIDNSDIIDIKEGKHPIIEASLPISKFIPNDTYLDKDNQLFLITGPNMAGKSTYIRQVAIIVIMAQLGSFVPAKQAHIGIIDKVFSRIGASDNLSFGQSTFMVEMTETANILHNATSKSLVILDEIGRGTSTYDGISIAWAVVEYLLTKNGKNAKTLFATHYWELTSMEDKFPHIVNLNIAVKETDDGIVFLRKIEKGGTDKSYGIHVAKLAGIPYWVIKRAEEMLHSLENKYQNKNSIKKSKKLIDDQYTLFPKQEILPKEKEIINEINKINLDTLSPLQAHQKLLELKLMLKG